jgi:hypothetical protein
VPTALIVGAAYTPNTVAVADTQSGKACASAPDTVLQETPVPKSQIKVVPAPTATAKTSGAKAPAVPKKPATKPVVSATPTPVLPQQPTTAPAVAPHGILGDLLDGIVNLGAQPTPTATPTPTAAKPAAPAPAATTAPTAPTTTAAPGGGTSGTSDATPGDPATPTPSASASGPNCVLDTSGVKAKAATGDVVPDQNWTLRSSRLALHGSVFNGVYDVRTPTGTKRVLKFTTASVDIGDLDMSTIMTKGNTFHVKGGPGTTSTMRSGPITMYVESLSGHLSAIYGLPIPIDLGEITLTPDTLPKWLWDLIGAVPIPLDITLDKAKAVQAGQFGGTLKIPGMKLYQDQTPYEG